MDKKTDLGTFLHERFGGEFIGDVFDNGSLELNLNGGQHLINQRKIIDAINDFYGSRGYTMVKCFEEEGMLTFADNLLPLNLQVTFTYDSFDKRLLVSAERI